ncbi:hypothetical protein FHG87_009019 [Trinorchestia longiramus]|nr:hypothetical protein FHG87_009019 [Trinorchestia longiramus]
MRVLEPAVLMMVMIMVVMISAVPTVPITSNFMKKTDHKATRELPQGDVSKDLTKFLKAAKETAVSHGHDQKRQKKDLSKLKFQENEDRRIQKKALEGMSEEKRSEKLKEMRRERKRAEIKAQDQEKSLQKLAKKHKSISGSKKTKKVKKEIQRIKREAEMKEKKQALKRKLAKELEKAKDFQKTSHMNDKHLKNELLVKKKDLKQKTKTSKELPNDKHLNKKKKHTSKKEAAKKFQKGSFVLKHLKEDHASVLKSAKPYMKEGKTLEERRALKALRLRVKREAVANQGNEATQTKTFSSTAVKDHSFKTKRNLNKKDVQLAAFEGKEKAALKGHHFYEELKKNFKNFEDEISGNELGNTVIPGLEGEALEGMTYNDEPTEHLSHIIPEEVPSEVPVMNDESAVTETTSPATPPEEFNEISEEEHDGTRITYEEAIFPGHSENSLESVDIVTLSSISVSESQNSDITKPTLTGDDNFDVPEISEMGDNSLLATEAHFAQVPRVTLASISTEAPGSVPTDTYTGVPATAPVIVPTGAPVSIPTNTPASVPTDTPVSVPTETSSSVPRGPWPWEVTGEDEEPCGRARFGRESRGRSTSMLKILQGKDALPGAFPWQVAILDKDRVSTNFYY